MGKKRKVTKTEIFLLLLSAAFLLYVLLSVFIIAPRRSGYTVTAQRHLPEEETVLWQIDLNEATAQQLQELDGIGPVLAQRIVAYRSDHGAFTDLEQLTAVEGIGESILDGIRDMLMIEEAP